MKNRRVNEKSLVFASHSIREEVGKCFVENSNGNIFADRNIEQGMEVIESGRNLRRRPTSCDQFREGLS
jgi:hypothetical protein